MDSIELCSGDSPKNGGDKNEILNGKNPKGDAKLIQDLFGPKVASFVLDGKVASNATPEIVKCSSVRELLDAAQDEQMRLRRTIRDMLAKIEGINNADKAFNLYVTNAAEYVEAVNAKKDIGVCLGLLVSLYFHHDLYLEMVSLEEGE